MDKPTQSLALQLTELCPSCRSSTTPVVTDIHQGATTLLTAAYRCVMCRTDFTSVWQQGYVRQNQPELPYPNPITQDVLPVQQASQDSGPMVANRRSAPDGVCQSCLAQPGTPHALACPYS